MLGKEEFISVVKHTPLVSIDLVVCSGDHKVLMGMRVNEPAAGLWFVPGGRIRKNESIEEAFARITGTELGKAYPIEHARLLGAFTHKYATNFAHEPDITTHYVVLAYQLQTDIDPLQLPVDQHSDYRWIGKGDDLASVHPHAQAYFGCLCDMRTVRNPLIVEGVPA